MMFSKKIVLAVMAAAIALLSCSAAFAAAAKAPATAQNIGVIDRDEIVANHPRMAQIRDQMMNISRKKEEEARVASEKEPDQTKKAQLIYTKRMELAQEQQKIMDPVFSECQQAIREVAVKQKLDLVLDKSVVLIGGKDITQDVIQQLAKTKAK